MRRIIKEGVKTRVLMLSATPVNNRLADLRNQIAFVTEGDDAALVDHGISSIDNTTRLAQKQFNRWLDLQDNDRTPARLVEMLGFDYFSLLDLLTIARSRKHVEKYYGTAETGRFPARLKPINIKADVDLAGQFQSIRNINFEIRRLNLAAYAPLRYVLGHKQAAYDAKYSTEIRGGEGFFRQADREESLIHLLRVNVLKRMESAVSSFSLTVERQAEVPAVEASVYCEVFGRGRDGQLRQINIGDPDSPDISIDQWNGHVVVLTEGHLIDTTLYRVRHRFHRVGPMITVPLIMYPLNNADGRQIIARQIHKDVLIQWTLYADNPDWPGIRDGTSGDEIFKAVTALFAAAEAKPSRQDFRREWHPTLARVHSPADPSHAP
jgi:hypothetical protein